MEFLLKSFNTLFPVMVILLIPAAFARDDYRKGPALRLVLSALAVMLALRIFIFLVDVPFAHRYLLLPTVLFSLLAAPGVFRLTTWQDDGLAAWRNRWAWLNKTRLQYFLFAVIITICAGKAMSPRFDKKWLRRIPREIIELTPPGATCYLITDHNDPRIAYYAGAEHLRFSFITDNLKYYTVDGERIWDRADHNFLGIIARTGTNQLSEFWVAVDLPVGIRHFSENVRALGGDNVFVLIRSTDREFRQLFADRNLEFKLKLIREYQDHKGRPLTFYQGSR